ncbi:MAG: hypothetical protein HYX41_01030 [Bdellovibrio sp.]|nr:hypothetical protein [Bdellovibrio sp.]
MEKFKVLVLGGMLWASWGMQANAMMKLSGFVGREGLRIAGKRTPVVMGNLRLGPRAVHNLRSPFEFPFSTKDEGLTEQERMTVGEFTDNSAEPVNSWLMSGKKGESEEYTVRTLTDVLQKLPPLQSAEVYYSEYRNKDSFSDFREGDEIVSKAFVRASQRLFASWNVLVVIQNPMSARDISHLSKYQVEQEVLFPIGTRFKIKSVVKGDDTLTVTMEEVPSMAEQTFDEGFTQRKD